MADFSMELNEDQLHVLEWVHDFAEDVVRPAAHEWDEREETPWPIIEEAAKIGLYSFDFIANCYARPDRASSSRLSTRSWPGATPASPCRSSGSTLGVAGIVAAGTPEQVAEWVPQCFGQPGDSPLAAFCVSEADAGSDVGNLKTRAVYDEASDTWTLERDQDRGSPTAASPTIHVVVAVGGAGSRGAGPGELRRAAEDAGAVDGPEVQEDGHPGVAHRRGRAAGREVARHLSARGQGALRRAARPGPRGKARQVFGGTGDLRGDPPRHRRPGGRDRPGRLRVRARLTPRSARPSGARSSSIRRLPSSSPT